MTWFTHAASAKPLIIAIPRHVGRLLEVGTELASLERVETYTSELQDDVVARREVAARVMEAERQLRMEIGKLLGGAVPCDWFDRNETLSVASPRDLARVLSDISDRAYSKAPRVHNELLNRRQISSAAAAARRTLMEAMVTHSATVRLGFEGTPPEVSMYRSLLENHGLHKVRDGALGFGAPTDRRPGSLRPAWDAIDKALANADEARLRVSVIFEHLRRPPYGLKDGLLPVLLTAAMLAWKEEVALYEDGVFVPNLNGAVVERLLRAPDKFEVQRFAITGQRSTLYSRLAQMISGPKAPSSGLVAVVRALVRVARELNDYARTTRTVSPKAQAVREALLRAREPAQLLFCDLPLACGDDPFQAGDTRSETELETFVAELLGAVRELQQAYPRLLDTIEEMLRARLSLPAAADELRSELSSRATRLLPAVVDSQLKAFLLRAAHDLPRDEWLVSLGTLLGGKPPESWHDRDVEQLHHSLGLVSRRFASLESMMMGTDVGAMPNAPLLRIAITQLGELERERVIPLRPVDNAIVTSVYSQLRAVADKASLSLPRDAVMAALGLVARDIMAEINGDGPPAGHEVNI